MNRNFYKIVFIFLLIFCSGKKFYSQNPAACNNLVNLCTNSVFSFSANSGTGLPVGLTVSNPFTNPQPPNAGCMFTGVANPQWLLLNITTSGNLGFSFGAIGSAFPQAGNYDWIMWPYSPTACVDIFNNVLPPVSCNWNCTGGGGTGMGTIPAGGSPCNFQPSIPVVQGQQYIILITNPSGVNTPVSFSMTGSAAVSCNPILYDNQTACPGQLAVFTGTWVNSSGGTYTLQPGNVVQTNPSFTVSSLTTQVYTVTAQGTNLSSVPIADQTTFTLNINPVIPISVTTPTNYCYGSNATFTVSPAGTGTFNVTGPSAPTTSFATTSIAYPNVTTANIGTFTVAASYTNGCIGTQTTQVNVAPNHSITVSSNTNVCMNGTVNLTSSMPTATAYAWTGPNSFASALQNPVLNTMQPIESGVYTVTSNINFNGITCLRTNTVQVDVVATSPVTVTPSFTACQGSNVNLNASTTGIATYSWSGPGTYTSGLQNPVVPSILPSGAGNYTAIASFSNSALTCTTSAVSNVSVVATVPATVTVPQHICQGATANLVITAPGATGFDWAGPNAFTSTSASTNIANAQPIASGTYTGTAIFSIGTYTCSTFNTSSMSVVPTNTVAVTPGFTVCQGSNVALVASAAGAPTYSWSGPGTYTSSLQNPPLTSVLPSASGNYPVTAMFTDGVLTCTTGAVSNVSVVATVPATVTVPQHICQGATANLVITAPGATGFDWAGPNAFTSTSASTNIANAQPVASGTYTGTAIFSIGTYTCSTFNTSSMSVVPTNTVAVTPGFTVCQGSNVALVASAAGAPTYSWSGPGTYTSSLQNPPLTSVLPSASGNYPVTAMFTDGVLTCTTGAVSNVSVVAMPTTTVTYPANICQNSTANFTASAPGAVSYTWTGPNSFYATGATASIPGIQTNGTGIYTTTTLFSMGTVNCPTSVTNSVTVIGTSTVTVSPLPGFTVCAGFNVPLTSNAAGAVSYSWNGPGGYTSSSQNPTIPSILPSGSGIYTATAFFTVNNFTCTTSATLNGSVIAIPPLNVTAVSTVICATQNTTITASGSLTYTWTPAATLNTGNGATVIASPLVATVYSITATDASGCLKSNTIALSVNPQPTLSATSNTMCFGTSASLTVNGATSYTWASAATLSSANGSNVTATPPANTVYTITGSSNKGCLNTTTASVIVKPLPVLSISDHTICYGNSTNINVSGASTYTWIPATALNATNLPNVTSNPLQTITYSVTGTDAIGCKQTTVSTVVVNPLPVINVTSPGVICKGQIALLTASGANTYTWSNNIFTSSQSVNPTTPTTYSATGQDANGCINTGTVFLNVLVQPTLNITGSSTVCVGNLLTLTASGGSNYSWDSGETTNVITVSPQANTIYSVSAGISPCTSTTVFAVTVFTPQVPASYANPPTVIYGSSSVIHANVPAGYPYSWSSPEVTCSSCEANTVTPLATTVYSLTVADSQGCVFTSTVLVEVDIICGEVFVPSAFSPNHDGFNDLWCVYGNCVTTMNLQVYNRWGEKVFESNDKDICWDGSFNGVLQNDAVFIYQLTTLLANGEKIVKKGNVTLKR